MVIADREGLGSIINKFDIYRERENFSNANELSNSEFCHKGNFYKFQKDRLTGNIDCTQ